MATDDSAIDTEASAAPWRADIFGILPHPSEARVWLIPHEDGWSLSHVHADEEIWGGDLRRVTALMREALGIDVVAYRYAAFSYDEASRSISGVFVLDYRGAATGEPSNGQGVDRRMLASLVVAPEEHRALLDAYLDEVEGGDVPRERPPWARPGWFAEAETWILARLTELGYVSKGAVEQVRCWSLSCVLRAHTDKETVYFKTAAELPLFANEPALLKELSGWFPDHIPRPLHIDRERSWMLLADWGSSIGWEAPETTRDLMYRTLATLQIESSCRVDEMLAAGCVDRRLHVLATQIDPLLEDEHALSLLGDTERTRLRALGPRLKAMCDELASYNLPPSLVHGDLHPGNVALRDGEMLFFDWTDASVTHPFFDLMHLFHDEPEVRARLRDSYLQAWTSFEPFERLQAAWALAAPLCALHHTISYQYIVAGLETLTRPELASGLTYFGGKVLELMPE